MFKPSPTNLLQTLRRRNVASALLVFSLFALMAGGPALSQNGNGAQRNSVNLMVGTWGTPTPMQEGIMYAFDEYKADGVWRETTIGRGGSLEGVRTQVWGRYSVQATGGGAYSVTYTVAGFAPVQACTPGVGCTQMPGYPHVFSKGYLQADRDHLRLNDGSGFVMERVAQIPPQLTAALPKTKMFAPAPAVSAGGYVPSGGGVVTGGGSGYHVPGQGGTCDNLQQQRVCTINDGVMYTGRDGCQHCSK